jgi:SAM-dependent methyltransferase
MRISGTGFMYLKKQLEQAVYTSFNEYEMTSEQWKRYVRGFANLALIPSAEIAGRLKLPFGSRRILDIGGGHGLFSAAICRRNSAVHADVLELPQAAVHGREIVRGKGAEHSVTFTEGDMFTANWGEDYGDVLIFNVLHNCSKEQASFLCRKAFDALKPGGILSILDYGHKPRRCQPQFQGGFNELLFFLHSGTRAWPEAVIKQWVEDAFKKINMRYLLSIPEVFVTAWKQDRHGRGR